MEIINEVTIVSCKFEGEIYLRYQYDKYSEWAYNDEHYCEVDSDDKELVEKLEAAYQKLINPDHHEVIEQIQKEIEEEKL